MATAWERFKSIFVVEEQRASPNNPTTSLSKPAGWLLSLFSPATKSGVQVTANNVISLSSIWRATSIIAGSLASLPFEVVEEDENGSIRPARNHPLYRLVNSEPNPLYSSYIFIHALITNAVLTGNGFARIERDSRTARPEKFTIISSFKEEVRWEMGDDDILFYKILRTGEMIPFYDMIHIQNLGYDGLGGLNALSIHKETYGFGLAARDFGNVFYKNGAHLGGYIKYPGPLNDEQYKRLKSSWNNAYGSLDKAGRTAILEENAEFIPMGSDPEKAQMIGSQKFAIEDASRITGVPLHLLSSLDRATFNNIEHLSRELSTYNLRHWVEQLEQEYNRKIFRDSEKVKFKTRMNMDAIVRGDTKTMTEYIDKGVKGGWMQINEGRKLAGLNPIEGGDVTLVPLNMGVLQADGTIKGAGMDNEAETNEENNLLELEDELNNAATKINGHEK